MKSFEGLGTLEATASGYGSVPGKHTVPRREMTGLLHALLHTEGDATVQCDNTGVWRTFVKGPHAQPGHNGNLWHLIFRAAQARYENAHASFHLEWIKSHLISDVASAQGQCPGKLLANAIADVFADRAAELVQLSSPEIIQLRVQSERTISILKRLVAIAVKLAPVARVASRVVKIASRAEDKGVAIDLLATSLDVNF